MTLFSYPPSLFSLLGLVTISMSLCSTGATAPLKATVLTDANFSTAIERGHWVVGVFTPDCTVCTESLEPLWDDLADTSLRLRLTTNIAKINAEENKSPVLQFSLDTVPRILFISEGRYKEYKEEYSMKQLLKFLESDQRRSSLEPLPSRPSIALLYLLRGYRLVLENPLLATVILTSFGIGMGLLGAMIFSQLFPGAIDSLAKEVESSNTVGKKKKKE